MEQSKYLSVLCRTPAEAVKPFAEKVLARMDGLEVLEQRTGLVMAPMEDTAQGACFHLGEVLVAEAKVRVGGSTGYGACLGRDVRQALAIAVLDAAMQEGIARDEIEAFVGEHEAAQGAEDEGLLRKVEGTRAEMETTL